MLSYPHEGSSSTELMVILEPKLWSDGNLQSWLFCEIPIKMLQPHTLVGIPHKIHHPEITITGCLVHNNTVK